MLNAVVILGFMLVHGPWLWVMPGLGLDASWHLVLAHAAANRWHWGDDIGFTYGPLGFVVMPEYMPGLAPLAAAMQLGMAAAIAATLVWLTRDKSAFGRILIFVLVAAGARATPDVFYLTLPVTFALAAWIGAPLALLMPLAVLSGLVVLTKASFAVIALLAVVAASLAARRSILLVVALTVVALVYMMMGQQWGDFGNFLRWSRDSADGFAGAMSTPGPAREVLIYLVCAAALGLIWLAETWSDWRDRMATLAVAAVVALYLLLVFKQGFVRHDPPHAVTAWAGLAVLATILLAVADTTRAQAVMTVVLLIAAIATAERGGTTNSVSAVAYLRDLVAVPVRQGFAMLANPVGAIDGLEQQRQAALAADRAARPLPKLAGTVDIIANEQSAVIANGLDYRPRPIFQEYSVYTPGLIAANRAFFAGPRAPDWLLFRPGSIDLRLPAMTEGPSWPLFLGRYDPIRLLDGDLLLMQRRAAALPLDPIPVANGQTGFGAALPLPQDGRPLILALAVEPTGLGRLVQMIFKLPEVQIGVTAASGREQVFRLVPAIAREGFVVSPQVDDNIDFWGLAVGDADMIAGRRVAAVTVNTTPLGRWLYRSAIDYRLSVLPADPLRVRPAEAATGYTAIAGHRRLLQQLASSSTLPASHVALTGDELFAHAPAQLSLPAIAGRYTVGFGLRDGAWQGGNQVAEVCFSVALTGGASAPLDLWRRCLMPLSVPADRGQQQMSFEIAPSQISDTGARLQFSTTCPTSCAWAWSYWTGLDRLPPP